MARCAAPWSVWDRNSVKNLRRRPPRLGLRAIPAGPERSETETSTPTGPARFCRRSTRSHTHSVVRCPSILTTPRRSLVLTRNKMHLVRTCDAGAVGKTEASSFLRTSLPRCRHHSKNRKDLQSRKSRPGPARIALRARLPRSAELVAFESSLVRARAKGPGPYPGLSRLACARGSW
jgi:hypothetical protein